MSSDEVQLVRRAKKGDPAAFAELYDRYQPAIYRYVLFRVGSVATAEDLTGEVFVRLVEKIDDFTYRGRPLLAWLYTIARNLVMDYHRQGGQPPPLALDERLAAGAVSVEKAVEHRLTQETLATAIGSLTEEQRQVILLKFVEELDNQVVAQMLGKSMGAVKSLQHRALAALRRALEQGEG